MTTKFIVALQPSPGLFQGHLNFSKIKHFCFVCDNLFQIEEHLLTIPNHQQFH
jgi:hypothetical protein